MYRRADAALSLMGMQSFGKKGDLAVRKSDVAIAKNYLSEFELAQMQRIVSAYLDMAALQAMRKIPMTMEDGEKRLAGFLKLLDQKVLQDLQRDFMPQKTRKRV